jgi:acyl-CoA hydrolase
MLCEGLKAYGTRVGLTDVRVEHLAAFVSWTDSDEVRSTFRLADNYATPPNRPAVHAGQTDYLPIGLWRSHEVPLGLTPEPDVFLVPVSPPDAHGFCSFGPGVWLSKTFTRNARYVVAEVHEDFIRTGGENYVHVDEIDRFVEWQPGPPGPAAPQPSEEERQQVDAICTQVAVELINDGDTIQIGVGTVSAALGQFLDVRNDLGVQTELLTGGIAELALRGVVTGARKTIHHGKVVASAIAALPREELALIDGNPMFELYDFGYTDDLRRLIHLDPFVAVNNALAVDLTGQVAAESFDHRPYTGVGGQTVFMLAGAYSPNGKSISVLPSSSVPSGGGSRISRIVPVLPPGTPVTVPRTYVDFVVTEFGIAELRGRSLAERMRAMCEIAHPDFRDDLLEQGRRLYGG